MNLDKKAILARIRAFDLSNLFTQELGWDFPPAGLTVVADQQTFQLPAVAEKRGFVVYECPAGDAIPDYPLRRKIERQVAKSAHEHLIIFTDNVKKRQLWQWVRREHGRPLACREHSYYTSQTGEGLFQKLQHLYVSLQEEDELSLVHVSGRARHAFDVDRVTKRFFDRFQKEHARFLEFIKGIIASGDRAWYASLMLNRLMFLYFIQKKRFLDDDLDYLRNRLTKVKQQKGKDKFLTFYQYFLKRLFHDALADPRRTPELEKLLGKVPFVNGGLFDPHALENANPDIQIPDQAFERLFDFFDDYQWHLDDRPLRADNEINPDVLGYIFEKYINQKQMGAYYTKEDITGYIARNTVIPFLFDAAKEKCAIAFESAGDAASVVPASATQAVSPTNLPAVWRLLADDPNRYIYPAVRKGVDLSLPPEIAAGIADVTKRGGWNKPAPAEFALPTETWREHVARRQRCLDLRAKLKAGEIRAINDVITCNLDICQLAVDAIENCEGPELLRAFYKAIAGVSVLDPTCGSGAFLFAALNILEPLYEACLNRMQAFVDDQERPAAKPRLKPFTDFPKILAEANDLRRHPNHAYFVLKSIILNNLYGVDIMEEAVEICKLRLFLKLVAQVEKVDQLEPLPDIDFNIRPGNTLVGFARLDDVKNTLGGAIEFEHADEIAAIVKEAEYADKAFHWFHEIQTATGAHGVQLTASKLDLRQKLDRLNVRLDPYLAGEYGVQFTEPKELAKWKGTHQPFHWFAQFYGIMKKGGFDVIIGNPPWKEYAAVKREDKYTVHGYRTERCGNLHVFSTERALDLRSPTGRMSFIVQLPLTCSSRMKTARLHLRERSSSLHVLSFDDRPGKLFDGLEHCRSVIFLSASRQEPSEVSETSQDVSGVLATTRYHRWLTEARDHLFANIEFAHIRGEPIYADHFPKSVSDLQETAFQKLRQQSEQRIDSQTRNAQTKHFIFYQEATGYWVKATIGLPYYAKNDREGAPAHGRYLYFSDEVTAHAACAILNSSLFYAYFITHGDCFHLSDTLATGFPTKLAVLADTALVKLNKCLMEELKAKAEVKTINTNDGDRIAYAEFYASLSKSIIDDIDRALGRHYGFTAEELDFIINYDIKYRMGQDAGEVDE